MYELRILNGLHRGATLPLDTQTITIGAGELADVVMADHGIADDHAVLSRTEQGWLLEATGGAIYSSEQHQALTVLDLDVGGFARVGDIWLMIALENAQWDAPPAMPEANFDPRVELAEDSISMANTSAARDTSDVADMEAQISPPPLPQVVRRPRSKRVALAILTAITMLGGATAFALTTKPASPAEEWPLPSVDLEPSRKTEQPRRASKSSKSAGAGETTDAPTPAELAKLFRKRLSDADLLNRFDLALQDRSWSMKAQLDDEETARFERILTSFIKEHKITFPVSAKAVTAEAMLPFKIGQVISGADPSVVTQDGTRLHVGDDYRGVRVVAIQQNHLTFFGKRKIEVNW